MHKGKSGFVQVKRVPQVEEVFAWVGDGDSLKYGDRLKK